jgi:two-component system response regulator NreC
VFTLTAPDVASRPIQVVVADDHPIALRGIHALVSAEPGVEVLDACMDGDSLAWSIARYLPDVAVVDLHMPGRPVLELLPELREQCPDTQIVIVTMARESVQARRALAAGAAAYVLKDGPDDDVVAAIRAAAEGRRYVDAALAERLAAEDAVNEPGALSRRQLEILRLVALGYTNAQISQRLYLSVRTVESHRAHILTKLRAHGRHELVEFALAHGLIGAGRPPV